MRLTPVQSEVDVRKDVSESRDPSPIDLRMRSADHLGNPLGCFTENFEISKRRIHSDLVRKKGPLIAATNVADDFSRSFTHVVKEEDPATRHESRRPRLAGGP